MRNLVYFLGMAAGLGLTIQLGANSTLQRAFGSANAAALVNFVVGMLCLSAFLLLIRTPLPSREALASVPAWAWIGGALGAFYVASSTIVGLQLGATSLLALTLLGQLASALVVDHFGWLGLPEHPIDLARIVGVVLLLAGVWLIAK
jgi:bacterial/archaeal transporter family-2 protein